jgi:hypothetical protein
MSSIVVAGDTSGTITLQAPAVSGSSVLTLPATTATLATLTTPSFGTTIGVGGATASASGAGISFPATQSASSDANTLDDYEEGTWTPTITFGGGNTGVTYNFQLGRYTKIGNQVTIFMYFQLTNKGSSTGDCAIGGLPFSSVNIGSFYTGGAIRIGSTTGLVGAAQFYCSPNQATLSLEIVSNTRITNTNINSSSDFSLNWSYMV